MQAQRFHLITGSQDALAFAYHVSSRGKQFDATICAVSVSLLITCAIDPMAFEDDRAGKGNICFKLI